MAVQAHSETRGPSILTYFRDEWKTLLVVTFTGILYNVGMVLGPWLEGLMAQCLAGILQGLSDASSMLRLCLFYVLAIVFVQGMRALKRLYVRRFANDVDRRMKKTLYRNLLSGKIAKTESERGEVMTKALSDVDDCVEGMRKFTTELFDTGVVMISYLVVLFAQDVRITLLALIFPPVSYILAARLKGVVTGAVATAKKEVSAMSATALDRAEGALTYRIFGLEEVRDHLFEDELTRYEKAEAKANVLSASLMPLYQAVALLGVLPIFILGAQNVVSGTWDIAVFTMYVSVFLKLAVKSSHAAKLFNAVQRAQVSWKRIEGYLSEHEEVERKAAEPSGIRIEHLGFGWEGQEPLFEDVSFAVAPGEIVGVCGPVASGKSCLARCIAGELPHEGTVTPQGEGVFSILGHDPELLDATIEDNVCLGSGADAALALQEACLADEVKALPEGEKTLVGEGGSRLSGGQRQRLGLARTLCHRRSVCILDDPFASLDAGTEDEAFRNLQSWAKEGGTAVILISHRLAHFPELSQVVCLADGKASVGIHKELMRTCPAYRALFELSEGGEA